MPGVGLSPGGRARTHWQAVMADVDEQTWRRRQTQRRRFRRDPAAWLADPGARRAALARPP